MIGYEHKKIKPLRLVAKAIRSFARLLEVWPLLLIAGVIISPVGPHLRWEYTYEQHGPYRHMIACEYLGSRGLVQYKRDGECPVFVIIDSRVYPSVATHHPTPYRR